MKDRISRVLENMKKSGLEQMIVSDPKSVWYLTGVDIEPYERLFALLLRTDGNHVFFLNVLFAVENTGFEEIWFSDTDDYMALVAEKIDGSKPLGIDKEWPARFLIPLLQRCPGAAPVLASDCVDDCRAVKDETEKALMREASRVNDEVITLAEKQVKPGITELELAEFIEREYKKAGASGPSFNTIVAFGPNAADPHHEPDGTVLKAGECVLVDMGCIKDRYCSDMTRTWFCGFVTEEESAVYELVRRANEAAEALVRPGVRLCDVDAAARDVIAGAGYGEYFTHRLGHFIGQADHEKGDVSAANEAVCVPGMVFSIEPGIYLPGKFGVRIEDLVIVTDDGCEVINKVDKGLKVLG